MTTGNDTQDFRVIQTDKYGDTQRTGTFWKRVWTGGDDILSTGATNIFAGYSAHMAEMLDDAVDGHNKYTLTGKPVLIRRVWVRKPKRARRGEHNYSMTLESYYNPYWTGKIGGLLGTGRGMSMTSFGLGVTFTQRWGANDDIALLGKLREKVVGSSFNAAVCMAEGKQSLELIASIARRLAKTLSYVEKGNFAAASKALTNYRKPTQSGKSGGVKNTVASNWLELQYGIKPLLNDVFDAAQSLAHFSSVPLQQVITVTRKVDGLPTPPSGIVTLSTCKGYTATKIKAVLKEVNVISLIGLTDPASVLWEKLPYSFVADWFVPVGNYLAARGLSQSITGIFVTTKTTKVWAGGAKLSALGAQVGYVFDGDASISYRYRSVSVERIVSTSLKVPTPEVKPLNKWATWVHAANAVALLTPFSSFRKR